MSIKYETSDERSKIVKKNTKIDYEIKGDDKYEFIGIDHTAVDMKGLTDSQIRQALVENIVSNCNSFCSHLVDEEDDVDKDGIELFKAYNEYDFTPVKRSLSEVKQSLSEAKK
jgi:hypothetical protein